MGGHRRGEGPYRTKKVERNCVIRAFKVEKKRLSCDSHYRRRVLWTEGVAARCRRGRQGEQDFVPIWQTKQDLNDSVDVNERNETEDKMDGSENGRQGDEKEPGVS